MPGRVRRGPTPPSRPPGGLGAAPAREEGRLGRLIVEKLPLFGLAAARSPRPLRAPTGASPQPTCCPSAPRAATASDAYATYLWKRSGRRGSRCFTSTRGASSGDGRRRRRTRRPVASRRLGNPAPPLAGIRMALVSGDARSGDRPRQDRVAGPGGPVHLRPPRRDLRDAAWGIPELIGDRKGAAFPAAGGRSGTGRGTRDRDRVQLGYWKDSVTLYERTLKVTTGNWIIHYNLANVLFARGDLEGALAHFGKPSASTAMRRSACRRGECPPAEGERATGGEAFARRPRAAAGEPHRTRGHGADPDGGGGSGRCDRDVRDGARGRAPRCPVAREPRARARSARLVRGAAASFGEALRLDPRRAAARRQLPIALNRAGRPAEAAAFYREVLRVRARRRRGAQRPGVDPGDRPRPFAPLRE